MKEFWQVARRVEIIFGRWLHTIDRNTEQITVLIRSFRLGTGFVQKVKDYRLYRAVPAVEVVRTVRNEAEPKEKVRCMYIRYQMRKTRE